MTAAPLGDDLKKYIQRFDEFERRTSRLRFFKFSCNYLSPKPQQSLNVLAQLLQIWRYKLSLPTKGKFGDTELQIWQYKVPRQFKIDHLCRLLTILVLKHSQALRSRTICVPFCFLSMNPGLGEIRNGK